MKKLVPFLLCSTAAAICLAAVSAAAGYLTPRIPPPDGPTAGAAHHTTPAPGTVWTVTTVNDDGPGSLREALASAGSGDVVDFALTLPATIVLSSTLVIDTDVAVLGPGPDQLTVMRSDAPSAPEFRVFLVENGVVTLAGLTIRNGSAFSGTNVHDNLGGGILNQGILTVSNCVVTGNRAPTTEWPGSTPNVSLGFGAGIFSYPDSRLSILNSTISDNRASGAGGALCTWYARSYSASGCTFGGNFAEVQGGALNLQGRSGAFQNCTFTGNATAPDGVGSAFLQIAFSGEGAACAFSACTIAGNTGSTYGACVLAALPGNAGLTHTMVSTLVAANAGRNFLLDGNPVFVSLGHNLDSDGTSGLANGVNGDLVGTATTPIDAKLGPLQDNGGPTLTLALLSGSPALDTGACTDANGSPLPVDQRGFPRPQGAGCDIGAYENQPLLLTCPPGVIAEFMGQTGAVVTFTVTVTDPCPGVTLTVTPPSGSLFPIGVTPVLAQATDACGNSAQCSFTVTVLGARGVKSNVLAELKILRADLTNVFDRCKLDGVIANVAASLGWCHPCKPLWWDETHLNRWHGACVFLHEMAAVCQLQGIIRDERSQIPETTAQNFIDRLVKCDRLLAVVSIQDAADAGVNPRRIAQGLREVARGDQDAAAGRPVQAIQHYWNAWAHSVWLHLRHWPKPPGPGMPPQFLGGPDSGVSDSSLQQAD